MNQFGVMGARTNFERRSTPWKRSTKWLALRDRDRGSFSSHRWDGARLEKTGRATIASAPPSAGEAV